jgi:hypothetical protein
MKKFLVLIAAMAMAVSVLGVGYALWSTELQIEGTVNTGTVEASWSVEDMYVVEQKDVSDIICRLERPDLMVVDLMNAYPSAEYYCLINIHSTGSVPIHIADVLIDRGNLPPGTTVEILPNDMGAPQIACSTQLHQGEAAFGLLHIHLENDAEQNTQYSFSVKTAANQYNEPDACGDGVINP